MRFTFLEDFLSLVFPRTCCGCKSSLYAFENELCKYCLARLPVTSYHHRPAENDLTVKLMGLTNVRHAISFLGFSKSGLSQRLLHQLKYKNKPSLGEELGKLYGQKLLEDKVDFGWEVIVAVPLHPLKLKRRGYNQSDKFAQGLGQALGLPVIAGLKRVKYTKTQTRKSRFQRMENVKEVFALDAQEELGGRNILLVDDVLTTGATLAACANVLLDGGAGNIDLAVIAAGRV